MESNLRRLMVGISLERDKVTALLNALREQAKKDPRALASASFNAKLNALLKAEAETLKATLVLKGAIAKATGRNAAASASEAFEDAFGFARQKAETATDKMAEMGNSVKNWIKDTVEKW